jgi:SAM-dependent methyltransferase
MSEPGRNADWQSIQDRFYDEADKHTHLAFDAASTYAKDLTDHLRHALQLTAGDRVLEVGAGAGRFTLHLAPYCRTVAALDTSPALLGALEQQSPPGSAVEPVCASVFDLPGPFGPASFDAVCGFFILHHLPDHEKLFGLIRGSLKPGGRVAFVEPNRLNPLFLVQVAVSREMTWEAERGMFTFSASRTAQVLRAAGFSGIRLLRFGLCPPQLLDRVPALLWLQRGLEKIPFVRRFLPFVLIVAEAS